MSLVLARQCFIAILLFCFLFPVSGLAFEPARPSSIKLNDYQTVFSYLDELIRAYSTEKELKGMSIAIVSDQNVIWKNYYGLANDDKELETNQSTLYQLGGLTGVLTAALIMKLVEADILNLDDDIHKYLPEFDIKYRDNKHYKITIRHLLSHHAGLPFNYFPDSWSDKPVAMKQILAKLNGTYASYPPDTIYAYSNIGYSLLGLIVEKSTALSFSKAIDKYVTAPLNMKNSYIGLTGENRNHLAIGYKDDDAMDLLLPRDLAALGVISNVTDIAKFMKIFFKQKRLNHPRYLLKKSVQEMISPQNDAIELDLDKKVGFSWSHGGTKVKNGGNVIWRAGASLSHRARLMMLPQHKLGVVILSNDTNSWEAMEKISEQAMQLMLEAKAGIQQPVVEEKDSESVKGLTDAATKTETNPFRRNYNSFLGYLPITKGEAEIQLRLLDWPFVLKSDGDGWFDLQYDLLGFIPIDISWIADLKIKPEVIAGKNVLVAQYKGKRYLVASEFNRQKVVSKAWLKQLGEYQVKNRDAFLKQLNIESGELKEIKGQLFFYYDLPVWFGLKLVVPLLILSDTEALIPGLGTGLNETVSISQVEGIHYLMYAGYLLEKPTSSFEVFDFFD